MDSRWGIAAVVAAVAIVSLRAPHGEPPRIERLVAQPLPIDDTLPPWHPPVPDPRLPEGHPPLDSDEPLLPEGHPPVPGMGDGCDDADGFAECRPAEIDPFAPIET